VLKIYYFNSLLEIINRRSFFKKLDFGKVLEINKYLTCLITRLVIEQVPQNVLRFALFKRTLSGNFSFRTGLLDLFNTLAGCSTGPAVSRPRAAKLLYEVISKL
jgi:hypothetical protein